MPVVGRGEGGPGGRRSLAGVEEGRVGLPGGARGGAF